MLPFFKALSLLGKVFSQPIVMLFKVSIQRIGGVPRETLVRWGNVVYNWEAWLNRRFLGYQGKVKEVLLDEEKALENFANFFIEVFVLYGVVGYLTITGAIEKHKEAQEDKQRKEQLEEEVFMLNKQRNAMQRDLELLRTQLDTQQQMWTAVIQGQNQMFSEHLQTSIQNKIAIEQLNTKLLQK